MADAYHVSIIANIFYFKNTSHIALIVLLKSNFQGYWFQNLRRATVVSIRE